MFDGLTYFFKKRKQEKRNKLIDKFIYPIVILGPIMVIPQVIKVWVGKNASGVSATSWAAFSLIAIAWLVYGTIHKDKLIIFVNILSLIFSGLVAIGTLLYG